MIRVMLEFILYAGVVLLVSAGALFGMLLVWATWFTKKIQQQTKEREQDLG